MKYKRVLIQLRTMGFARVFSSNLGDAIGISAALVRKDLAAIQLKGNRRGGYEIDVAISLLNQHLGGHEVHEAILVGCGNLGRALLNHEALVVEGIRIVSGFDLVPPVQSIGGVPIRPMGELRSFVQEHRVTVALLTVPADAATETRDGLFEAGVRGILNFTPVELKCPENCIIHNVNIGLEIENLFFHVNSLENDEKAASIEKNAARHSEQG